jgi:Ala-tRNA(Pro) deacylase
MARLRELGIETATVEHPPVFTVAESDEVHRQIPGAHTKNLFLKDAKGALFLVTALHSTDIDLKSLPKVIGSARLSFGKAELLMEVLGVAPGSVTAFAVMNDKARQVSVVLDAALMDHDIVNCPPLENTATTSIARDDLLRFIRATGHEPRICRLGST